MFQEIPIGFIVGIWLILGRFGISVARWMCNDGDWDGHLTPIGLFFAFLLWPLTLLCGGIWWLFSAKV